MVLRLTKIALFLMVAVLVIGCSDKSEEKADNSKSEEGDTMENLKGSWDGTINVPNQALSITISFKKAEEWTGTISIPVQGVKDHPLTNITYDRPTIGFVMKIPGQKLLFEGTINDGIIEGTFTQHGQTFPFELKKDVGLKDSDRDEENFLSIDTNQGTLYGELEKPKGKGPFPVMIIIPGSGPTDRDGNSIGFSGKNNSLKRLAEALADNGIASVRYDKRGVGRNQEAAIPETDLTFDQLIEDAETWIKALKQDKQFSQVGLLGHSQGSLVGMVSAQTGVDAFISIAGAGRPINEVLYEQLNGSLSDDLMSESKIILGKLKRGEHVEDVSKELESVFRPSVQAFLSSWMNYNPVEEIQNLNIPVLIINGNRDIQVPASDAKELKHAKDDAKLLIIEKMNHVLKEAPNDKAANVETYTNPGLPLADELVEGILSFLKVNGFLK
ncbi:alpha/beta hydrolase [Virgibacillus ndiopensis]|uniref:alpha/beta hydrolase n=1 Tax=Virgibacillus ndiopensis TaxID=2004408 RepID=UPI001FE63FEC|nr:alpha/beta fold hydrolase [Virgibacillus ndiopensis]